MSDRAAKLERIAAAGYEVEEGPRSWPDTDERIKRKWREWAELFEMTLAWQGATVTLLP